MYDRDAIYPVICQRISEGESLRSVCRSEDMPAISTVMEWLTQDDTFAEQYARAREARGDYHFERSIEIVSERPDMVDASEGGDTNHKAGGSRIDSGYVAWQRLQYDAHRWAASKMHPRKYADKIDHTLASPDGGPVQHQHKVTVEYVDPPAGGVPLPAPASS